MRLVKALHAAVFSLVLAAPGWAAPYLFESGPLTRVGGSDTRSFNLVLTFPSTLSQDDRVPLSEITSWELFLGTSSFGSTSPGNRISGFIETDSVDITTWEVLASDTFGTSALFNETGAILTFSGLGDVFTRYISDTPGRWSSSGNGFPLTPRAAVPEPGSVALLASALAGFLGLRLPSFRRRRKA